MTKLASWQLTDFIDQSQHFNTAEITYFSDVSDLGEVRFNSWLPDIAPPTAVLVTFLNKRVFPDFALWPAVERITENDTARNTFDHIDLPPIEQYSGYIVECTSSITASLRKSTALYKCMTVLCFITQRNPLTAESACYVKPVGMFRMLTNILIQKEVRIVQVFADRDTIQCSSSGPDRRQMGQATVLDARASRVKWPAQFMSHWYGILFTE